MRNPLVSFKAILGELLVNGRQALQQASLHADCLATIEQRMTENEHVLSSLVGSMESVRLGVVRLVGAYDLAMSLPRSPIEDNRMYFGLDELDRTLKSYTDCQDGYFVELGANDGVEQSNTLHFEKFCGWSGVLVEPTPHNFLKCRANRSSLTHIFCCACVAFDYPEKFVELAFSNLMTTPIGLDSDIPDAIAHSEEGRRFLAPTDTAFTFGAPARTLNSLLLEAGSPTTIDLLSLDVEGAELEVLKGVNHDHFRFRHICVECRDIARMTHYLAIQGYDIVAKLSIHDYLFRDIKATQG